MKNKVFITDYIQDPTIEKRVLGEALSTIDSKDIEVLLVWHEKVNGELLDKFPKLRGVVRYGVGYDNIDLEECVKRNVIFCNTPDYGVDEVSDTTIALSLNFVRGISRYDYVCRNLTGSSWQENTLKHIRRISSLTLGVVGAGRIGGSVLLKANALGFKTAFYDPYIASGYDKMYRAKRELKLDDLLKSCDIISMHCPLSEKTRGMVDAKFLENMKTGSILINTARGGLLHSLDEVYSALHTGKLSAAGLDVLPEEPPKSNNLIDAWRNLTHDLQGRLIINPHTAYYSVEAFDEMRFKAAENALRIVKGEHPLNIITA